MVETLRSRRDGGSHILGEAGVDTDVAGVEIKSRAGLVGAGKAQLPKQIAIHRVSLGAARADYIEIAVAKAFERAARDVEFAQRISFELLCQRRNVGELVQILIELLCFGDLLLALSNDLECLPDGVDLLDQACAVMHRHPLCKRRQWGREQQCCT